MLVIRPEQLQAFDGVQRRRLARELAAALRERSPEARAWPDDALLALMEATIARGARYGIRLEADLVKLAAIALRCGAAFDEEPWVQAILADPTVGASRRANRAHLALAAHAAAKEPS